MIFIEYPKCSTCKNAKKYLDGKRIIYKDRSIVDDTPSYEELKKWVSLSGKDINKFFNTSGIKYMNSDEKLKILSTDGMLIKRPILVSNNFVLIGFKKEEWDKCLENVINVVN